jgi:hypothetical protein
MWKLLVGVVRFPFGVGWLFALTVLGLPACLALAVIGFGYFLIVAPFKVVFAILDNSPGDAKEALQDIIGAPREALTWVIDGYRSCYRWMAVES